ncbi:MAG: hypothetical protein KC413_21455 [Anaerolineales bacterium]|nr:hypothetical protein [Anaerolineales bacterium]
MRKLLFIGLLLLLLPACGGEDAVEPAPTTAPVPTNTIALPTETAVPSGETIRGQAVVDSIEVEILESFPVQVNVIARGSLPDGCTQIENVIQQRDASNFQIVVTTLRPGDRMCTQNVVPFTETIPLDVVGLEAGAYDVEVNGRTGSFTLSTDNSVAAEPTETPAAAAESASTPEPEAGALSGLIWHDVCAVAGGEGDTEAEAGEGCIANPDGGFRANGVLDEGEPGIAGILVELGEGACPAVGLATTTTDDDGAFAFADLPVGEYCVSVNPLDEQNEPLLVPGEWTVAGAELGSLTITVAAGETATGADLGWDYQFLPIPEVDLATCTNSMAFVADLTVPDDTVFAPGTELVKEWRLRNSGTCPWTTDYAFVAIDEEPLAGDAEVALATAVAPGQTIDIAVNLIAPDAPGTYRSNWQMTNANGDLFGVGGFIEDAIYLRIVVEEGADTATPEPNSAAIGGVVWADYCLLRSDGSPSAGCIETEDGSGIYIADGTYAGYESPIAGLTISLSPTACPADATNPTAVLATTTTDDDGLYSFTGLDAGSFCVWVDAFSAENVDLLIPGDWTYPAPGVGALSVILSAGEERLAVDFGWDYVVD